MSSISSVSAPTDPYQTTSQSGLAQFIQDFNSIGSALQSGDLSSAQSALAAFQQDVQGGSQASASQPFGQNTQANADYQSLTSALKSGDLSGAQTAFASLQKDLQGPGKTQRHHHYDSTGTDNSQQNSAVTDTSTTSEALDSLLNVTG